MALILKKHRIFWLLIVGIIISEVGFSQEFNSTNYTVTNGLPSSQVYDIIQDKNGYIWFATDRGLAKYDGSTFKIFGLQDGMTDNCIFHFYQHPNGTIWCIPFNNKLFYIDEKDEFIPYKYNKELDKENNRDFIFNIVFYKKNLYLSYYNQAGYLKINNEGVINNFIEKTAAKIVSERINNSFFSYRKSDLPKIKESISASEAVFTIKSKGDERAGYISASIGKTALISDGKDLYITNNKTTKLIQNKLLTQGIGVYDSLHFWVGYKNGGVSVYDLKGVETFHFLGNKSVVKVFRDHENGIWVSTLYSGVYYFKNNAILTYYLNEEGKNHVQSLTSTPNGELYIGYKNGYVYKLKEDVSELIYKPILDKYAEVQFYNSINDVIIGVDRKVFESKKQNEKREGGVLSFSDDPDSEILFGSHSSFKKINESIVSVSLGKRIKDICKVKNAYYLSTAEGIYYYKDSLQKLNGNKLYNYRIDDIDYYNGKFYGASFGAGLIIFNTDSVFNISEKDGLYSNISTEILVENDSTVWVCGNKGLNKVLFKKNGNYSVSGLSISDGLPSNEIIDIEIIGNKIFIATSKGLCSFDKSVLSQKENEHKNNYLSIQKTEVNDNVFDTKGLKNLAHKQNRIKINFQAISFKYSEKMSFRYKLEGLENNWNYTNNKSVTYPSLPHGDYNFVLETKTELGKWENNKLSFPLIIHPAFYQTYWFLLLIISLIAFLVYLFFKYNILAYNKDITRELLRKLLKLFNRKTNYLILKEQGKEIKVETSDIFYIKAYGNYLEIYTQNGKITTRGKIGDFKKQIPDTLEFLRIHRSYIIRVDKIEKKDVKFVYLNNTEIPIGESYKESLKEILI